MTDARDPIVFDGHNDVLTRLSMAGGTSAAASFLGDTALQVDLPKLRRGGFGGGFFALWVPSPKEGARANAAAGDGRDARAPEPRESGRRASARARPAGLDAGMDGPSYDLALPAPLDRHYALDVVLEEAAILFELERLGALRVCTSTDAIRRCFAEGTVAAVMHVEGAEAIDPELRTLELLYRAGLRSLGPVWSRHTAFAEGVPFRFPATPDIGGGLTDAGFALVRRCNELGILVDLSHLNEAGFDDVARTSDAPLVATHSNAHRHCAHARNLTDRQLERIAASDGVVGVNFACAFLREDGRMRADVSLDVVLRHLDHLLEHLGEGGVALGSDFDGAVVPDAIRDAGGLGALRGAMRAHGYGEALLERICHGNWLRVLATTWHETTRHGKARHE